MPSRSNPAERMKARKRLQAIRRKLDSMRIKNDESETDGPEPVRLSRACACCSYQHEERYASVACGHAVCAWCRTESPSHCLPCEQQTRYVRIYEDELRCGVCLTDQPVRRGLFSGCGHTLCAACMGRLWYHSVVYGQAFACPQCRRTSRPVQLREQPAKPVHAIMAKKLVARRVQQRKPIAKARPGRQRRASSRY